MIRDEFQRYLTKLKPRAIAAAMAIFGPIASSLVSAQANPEPPSALKPWLNAAQDWMRDSGSDGPIVALGEKGQFDDTHIFAPTAARSENGGYQLWYCGSTGNVADRVFQMGLASSENGRTFARHAQNPVFDFGDGRHSVLTPSLLRDANGVPIREAGRLRLWFSATWFKDPSGLHTLRETSSADGLDWAPPSDALLDHCYAPSVLKTGDTYQIWYTDVSGSPWIIRHASSSDGRKWSVTPEPSILIDQEWEKSNLFYPHVIKIGDAYLMWYGSYWKARPSTTALGFAASLDGTTWYKASSNPVLRPDESRPWESHYVTSHTMIRDPEDGSLRAFFASRTKPPHVNKYFAINTAVWKSPPGSDGSRTADSDEPHPVDNPTSPKMLAVEGLPDDPAKIDFKSLPQLKAEHAVLSDVRDQAGKWVHQHAYLAHHHDRYWAMWSDGPGLPQKNVSAEAHRNKVPGHDQAGTRVSYATSEDGIKWSPPGDLSGPPRKEGHGWIARGLWIRNGELLSLASHFKAPSYAGDGLSLEAFRWDEAAGKWQTHGTIRDDSMNNFPPKKLPGTDTWMMTRRDGQRQVSVMIGGEKSFDDWQVHPMASYNGKGRPEEPYWYVLPDGKNLVGLIRDNGRSGRLLRTFSTDNGRSWSPITRTDFPDATSKFFVHRTSRGYYAMVSNSNPKRRDPLTLAISTDGLVFTDLFYLAGGRHIDYPHIIEHDGHLLIAFSGAKQTMEVLKISLDEIDAQRSSEDDQ